MSTLITGASGFIGAALARTLRVDGEEIISLVRDWTREPAGIIVRGDVTDRDLCSRILADYRITLIYHLAAQSIVSACAEDPLTALRVSVMGTATLLQAVREADRPIRVIVSTSDKVYGSAPSPYTEKTPLDARHAYEVSKACQDLVSRMFYENYKVDVQVVRAVNIYGPGDPNESRVIPRTIRRLLRGEPPLLHAGAAAMRRQYVYIDDLLDALRLVAASGMPGEAYCVGSPSLPISVAELIDEVSQQMTGRRIMPEISERDAKFLEIQEQSVNDQKIRSLGWEPTTLLPDGISKTIEWYRAGGRC